jgi:mono/diheme cytochrome c family protein
MTSKRIRYLTAGSAALFVAVAIGTTAPANGTRSTKDGVFTAAQAERGKAIYEQSCKNCHPAEFYTERLLRWENKPVSALFEAVSTTMPADNVGALATSEYVDVLAYVFSITGSPAGKTEITPDNFDAITIAVAK